MLDSTKCVIYGAEIKQILSRLGKQQEAGHSPQNYDGFYQDSDDEPDSQWQWDDIWWQRAS